MDLRYSIGEAVGTDYFGLREPFTPQQESYLVRTREFVDAEVLPVISGYRERAEFPWALIGKMARLGIVGDGIEGYGCPPMDPLSAGLINNMEISRGDGSLGHFPDRAGRAGDEGDREVRVRTAQAAVAGTDGPAGEDRRVRADRARARLGLGLAGDTATPTDSPTSSAATRNGSATALSPTSWSWARDTSEAAVKGFLIEKGTLGDNARVMEGKASLRAVWQAEIEFDGVRVPAENRLPGANSFKDCAAVLTGTRSACAWMALGHVVSGFDAALTCAKQRKQFGKPLASFQIIQQRLVRMLADVTAMQLYCVQIAKLDAAAKLAPTLAGLAKLHDTSKARVVLADARDMLGGNGILLDFHLIRHMADIEPIHTFEGTETIQSLIVGRDISGIGAFS